MLYIFYVNIGKLIKLDDLSLAAGNVSDLQTSLEGETGVPVGSQLLLVLGGVTLEPSHIVCNYGAGTDTNPIFLFSKQAVTTNVAPNVTPTDKDLQLQNILNRCTAHTKTLAALQLKTNAAQELASRSQQLVDESEELARSQALQGKGWQAVMQNLDRSVRSFSTHFEKLKESVGSIQVSKSYYNTMLSSYKQDLEILRKLPFFDCFNSSLTELLPGSSYVAPKGISCLLDWIESQDPNSSIDQLADESKEALAQFHNNEEIKALIMTSQEILDCVENDRMRKIKGLEERLRTLQNFLRGAQEILQSQVDRAKGLQQQTHRAMTTNDTSVLSDLFEIQQQQLTVMYNNCQQLIDIRDKFFMTKQELTSNIHQRLMWVKSVENELVNSHSKSLLFIGNSKRLQKRFEILSQIHQAPQVYVNCINEVLRRRDYSKQFETWSSDVANLASSVRDSELESRKGFLDGNGHHFLLSLFPGMTDPPSSFATNVKTKVDETLPDLQAASISEAIQRFPRDLASSINLKNEQILYTSTSNQMSTQEGELVQEYRKQVEQLNEQLQNLNNEHEIERASLLAVISSHKKHNDELLTQKLELENSLAEVNSLLTESKKHSDKLHSQIDGQSVSIHAYETKLNNLNGQLDQYRIEIEGTVHSNQQLVTQQDAIAQAYQVEKLRCEELESRLSASEDCLKNVRQVFGHETGNEVLSSEVQRVVLENQNLKSNLEQVSMDVSIKEYSEEELKREVATLKVKMETLEQERNAQSLQERTLERVKFERDLYTERQKHELDLDKQRDDLERQHTARMDNEKIQHEDEIVAYKARLSELLERREVERRVSWNHKEVETIKKLAIASSPPGSDPTQIQLLDNLVSEHKTELEAKNKTLQQMMERESADKLDRQEMEARIQDLERELSARRASDNQYSENIISQQPGYQSNLGATPFQALLPLYPAQPDTDSNAINRILKDYKAKLFSHLGKMNKELGLDPNPIMTPTSMDGSYVSLGDNIGEAVNNLTDDMCRRVTDAKDELTRELQTNQRDLGQANTKCKHFESQFLKLRRNYKEALEQKSQEKVQETEYRDQIVASQDAPFEPFSLELGPQSFYVLDEPMNSSSEAYPLKRQVPKHLSPPIPIRQSAIAPTHLLEQAAPQEDMEKASLKEFRPGDIVVFFLDNLLKNYLAVSIKETIYYMHDECLSQYLGPQRDPPRSFVFGRVSSTPECCKIIKTSRKRNLPVGTVFYRMKVERFP